MIPFKGLNYNPAIQAIGLDLIESGTGAYASAVIAARGNPLNLLYQSQIRGSTEFERMIADKDPDSEVALKLGPRLTSEEANKKYGLPGVLEFDEDIYDYDARIRNENASVIAVRSEQVQRAKKGFWNGTARFTGTLLASFVDPINIGASFIPIVGQARYAKMIRGIGVSGARISRGAIEGSVGAAMLEPAIFALHDDLGLNYGIEDSITNIAFGTALGSGLHFGAPLTRDVFNWGRNKIASAVFGKKLLTNDPDIPDLKTSNLVHDEAVLKATIAQIIDGQQVNGAVRNVVNAELGKRAHLASIAARSASMQKDMLRSQLLSTEIGTVSRLPNKEKLVIDEKPGEPQQTKNIDLGSIEERPVIVQKMDNNISDADIKYYKKVEIEYRPIEITEDTNGRTVVRRIKTKDGLFISYKEIENLSGNKRLEVSSSTEQQQISDHVLKGTVFDNDLPDLVLPKDWQVRMSEGMIEGRDFNIIDPESNNIALDRALVGINEAQTYNKSLSPDDYKVAEEQTVDAKERLKPTKLKDEVSKLNKEINDMQQSKVFLEKDPEFLAAYKAEEEKLKRLDKAEFLYTQAAICIVGGNNG